MQGSSGKARLALVPKWADVAGRHASGCPRETLRQCVYVNAQRRIACPKHTYCILHRWLEASHPLSPACRRCEIGLLSASGYTLPMLGSEELQLLIDGRKILQSERACPISGYRAGARHPLSCQIILIVGVRRTAMTDTDALQTTAEIGHYTSSLICQHARLCPPHPKSRSARHDGIQHLKAYKAGVSLTRIDSYPKWRSSEA